MFKLDNAFLEELGLGSLPPAEKNKMLAHIYETLEMRVGMRLAEQMSNEQLDEFESYINRQDEAGALKWLETNFPNYKQVVAEELDKLKNEIKQVSPQIVAQSVQNNAHQQSDTQQQPLTHQPAQPATQTAPQPLQNPPQLSQPSVQSPQQPAQPTPQQYNPYLNQPSNPTQTQPQEKHDQPQPTYTPPSQPWQPPR